MTKYATAVAAALCLASVTAFGAAPAVPASINAAINDAARPPEDKQRDADRKPAESLAFAGVKAGDKVIDFWPGGGYFTRLFAKAAGPNGKVFAITPQEFAERMPQAITGINAVVSNPAYANVTALTQSAARIAPPEPVDVVWTSQNYHDLHNMPAGTADAFNKAIFAALKPGGVFVVLDHNAAAGTGFTKAGELHRAEMAAVRDEVLKAGFVLDGESTILRNPADDGTKGVRDPSLRGHTDQFILRFRKPG